MALTTFTGAFSPVDTAQAVCQSFRPHDGHPEKVNVNVLDDCGYKNCDGANVLIGASEDCSSGCSGVNIIVLSRGTCGSPDDFADMMIDMA